MHDDQPTRFYRIGETRRYEFQDPSCLMASCWDPGAFLNTRNGKPVYACEHRATKGCPNHGDRGLRTVNAMKRHSDGWKEDKP